MSLLTPSESLAFNGFLHALDLDATDWERHIPHARGKEALAKATKDLMSLSLPTPRPAAVSAFSPSSASSSSSSAFTASADHLPAPSAWPSLPSERDSPPELFHYPPPVPFRRPYADPLFLPPRTGVPSTSSSTSSFPTAAAASSSSKRPLPAQPDTASKRARSSLTRTRPHSPPADAHARTPPSDPPAPGKPALLSASQKRANHIQSEQKRRANIRRGYDGLCDAVPALREAIRAEEAAEAASGAHKVKDGRGDRGRKGKEKERDGARRERRRKGRGVREGEDGEERDGRAGPKSENVVLQKTIDYITGLLAARTALLTRLDRARAALPPGHPALANPATTATSGGTSTDAVPLWEREWHGGTGRADDDGSDDEDA